jgi:hypothetical protein
MESIPWNRFLCSLNVYPIRAQARDDMVQLSMAIQIHIHWPPRQALLLLTQKRGGAGSLIISHDHTVKSHQQSI